MNLRTFSALMLSLGCTTVFAHDTGSGSGTHLHGTSIFHRYLKMDMAYVGPAADPEPTGRLDIKHNQQGKSDRQQMMLKFRGLDPETTYHVLVWMGDDVDPMPLTSFDSRGDGKGKVKFKRKLQGKGNSKHDLPNLQNPVDDIRRLALADDGMNVLLEADLEYPDKLHYLVKRELDNDDVDQDAEGVLHLKGSHNQSWLRLRVGGLDADTAYDLSLNGEDAEMITTDGDGGFETTTTFDVPLDVLLLRDLSILNGADESVLSTGLPRP